LLTGCMVALSGRAATPHLPRTHLRGSPEILVSGEGEDRMSGTLFDAMPLWLVLLATCGFILLMIEAGFRVGIIHARRSEDARQAAIDALVGSTLGLLAFMLAFTFGMATSRYDTRRQLVVDDMIAIRTADLRAQLLPEPHRSESRALLREYVDVRVRGATVAAELPQALSRTEQLQGQLWSRAAALTTETPALPSAPGFVQALIQMIDLNSKRVTAALHNNIPRTIWIAVYCLTGLAMAITGYREGISGRRNMVATVILVLAFASVIVLIADLDRPQEGLLTVSQQAMLELQKQLRNQ
jgi:hypothetical protein